MIGAMSKPSPQMATLWSALQRCGGEPALAKALGVTTQILSSWLVGRDPLPAAMYLKARSLATGARR
jgi:DNA-binding transcriptional regulator YdaS (Cro superfamily)